MTLLNLRDGGHLKYEESGSGQPMVLLHGWAMRGEFFKKQVAGLSARFRIVVPDLRGHGASSYLEDGKGLPTLVNDVAELLVSLDLKQTILVGWSMGAMICWGLMQKAEASRISSLVTIDMVPKLLNDDKWKFGLRAGSDARVFSGAVERMLSDWPGFTRTFVPRIFARERATGRAPLIDWIITETQDNDPASMALLWQSMVNQDFRSQLPHIGIPCLVAYGAQSQLYSEEATKWVREQLPNARGILFADSGHAPHLEEPDLFNRAIEEFADDIKERNCQQFSNQ